MQSRRRGSMEKIEIELDKQTLENAKLLAAVRQCTLPELMVEVIKQLGSAKVTKDP